MKKERENLSRKVAELEIKCKLLEKSLQQSEERFFKVFHSSSNMMAIHTIREGRFVDLNEAAASLGGFKRADLIGQTMADRGLMEDPSLREVVNQKLQQEGRAHNLEMKVRTKNGDMHTVLFSADPITLNNEPCMLAVSVDITEREKEANALRESEEKYRLLVENSLQGLSIIQDERFVFCNNTFATMTGYSVEELLSLPDSTALLHPEDRAAVYGLYLDRVAGRPVPAQNEHRIIKKDGTVRWMEIRASSIKYRGRPAIQVVNMDITERRQAQDALRESEERFRLITETVDEVFWIYDLGKKAATYLSPAFERTWGFPRERILTSPGLFLDSVHPDDRAQVSANIALLDDKRLINCEYRIIRPDGSIRNIWERGFPIAAEHGLVKHYIGIAQDVTGWRLAEEELQESREYLNQIINCIGDPVFVKDRKHRFVLVNNAMCTFRGIPREELLGVAEMPRAIWKSLWEQEEAVFETGKEILTEDEFPVSQDRPRIMMAKKSLLTDKNGDKQVVGVLRDITEYKRLEAQFLQAQKMEAIGLLAGGVAHDFNNLLSVINGYCELTLEDIAQNNPIRSNIEQILEAGKSAASLTSQLLAFGRKQILQPEILDLNDIITQMSSMLRPMIRENIELITIAQPGLGRINVDPGQIQQIVMNLAVNACDAMLQGGNLTIETTNVHFDDEYIRKHPEVKAGSYVMLAISDNGIGMDAATQACIFEPFFTTKGKGKGTGLGLATVYGIVKQSNGFIWVYSEPGKGTTFKAYFPRVEGDVPGLTEESKSEQGAQGVETVLIAEDEPSVLALAARILRGRGYTVFEASDGKEALDIAEKYAGEIHLVLTDIVMPGISGRELVSRLEAIRPGIKSLYVSGYTDNAIVHDGMLDSGIAFLQKPFTVEDLARKAREVLNS